LPTGPPSPVMPAATQAAEAASNQVTTRPPPSPPAAAADPPPSRSTASTRDRHRRPVPGSFVPRGHLPVQTRSSGQLTAGSGPSRSSRRAAPERRSPPTRRSQCPQPRTRWGTTCQPARGGGVVSIWSCDAELVAFRDGHLRVVPSDRRRATTPAAPSRATSTECSTSCWCRGPILGTSRPEMPAGHRQTITRDRCAGGWHVGSPSLSGWRGDDGAVLDAPSPARERLHGRVKSTSAAATVPAVLPGAR
jgi:hypothetical protein